MNEGCISMRQDRYFYINEVAQALLSAPLPISDHSMTIAAKAVIDYYADNQNSKVRVLPSEVASRFLELWKLWVNSSNVPHEPGEELKDVIKIAISADEILGGSELPNSYFDLEATLETSRYLNRSSAVELIGSAGLIYTLFTEQHLSPERIRVILNIPEVTFDAVKDILSKVVQDKESIKINSDEINSIYEHDCNNIARYFGDMDSNEAFDCLEVLLSEFNCSPLLWENVASLVAINFPSYTFLLYYELLTLEKFDRFPGRAVYEHSPRGNQVKSFWKKMFPNGASENPYLNDAKSVNSLDFGWAQSKVANYRSNDKKNGSILLSNVFDEMQQLSYSTRKNVARIIRSYIIFETKDYQECTELDPVTPVEIERFIEGVVQKNSQTQGLFEQRLVDFLTLCFHKDWVITSIGSSVNESNTSAKKYGDTEYLNGENYIDAFEAHGGSLRDEYVQAHIDSLGSIVEYWKKDFDKRGDEYDRDVSITYVAHQISRLGDKFANGCELTIKGVHFRFDFITFSDLLDRAGGIERVSKQIDNFNLCIHKRLSSLPDIHKDKKQYCRLIDEAKYRDIIGS